MPHMRTMFVGSAGRPFVCSTCRKRVARVNPIRPGATVFECLKCMRGRLGLLKNAARRVYIRKAKRRHLWARQIIKICRPCHEFAHRLWGDGAHYIGPVLYESFVALLREAAPRDNRILDELTAAQPNRPRKQHEGSRGTCAVCARSAYLTKHHLTPISKQVGSGAAYDLTAKGTG